MELGVKRSFVTNQSITTFFKKKEKGLVGVFQVLFCHLVFIVHEKRIVLEP